MIFLLCIGCQSVKNYNNYLVEKSTVSEIPTLMGNILGGAVATPLLLFTIPVGYSIYDGEKAKEFIATPIKGGAYGGGVILGSLFLPVALLTPEKEMQERNPNGLEKKESKK